MPFRSKRQQRFMYATKPEGVDLKEWAEKTNFKKLPEKVRKKKDKNDVDCTECAECSKADKALELAAAFEYYTKYTKLSL